MRINPKETLLQLKIHSKVGDPCYFSTFVPGSKFLENYHLNEERATILPYRNQVKFINESQMADIDLSKLYEFPNHKHILHVATYNKKNTYADPHQYKISVEIMRAKLDQEADRTVKILFTYAELSHKTETFGRMTTYLKMFVNKNLLWTSKVDQKGDRCPVYEQRATFKFNSLQDEIKVEVWDKDMKNDDLVGEFTIRVYQLVAVVGQDSSQILKYEGKNAGVIHFFVQEAPKIQ